MTSVEGLDYHDECANNNAIECEIEIFQKIKDHSPLPALMKNYNMWN